MDSVVCKCYLNFVLNYSMWHVCMATWHLTYGCYSPAQQEDFDPTLKTMVHSSLSRNEAAADLPWFYFGI